MALAGTEVFENADAETQTAARRLGDALDVEMAASDLTPGRQKLVLKMLPHYWPDVLEIAEGDRTAKKVLGAMVARIADDKQNTEFKAREIADFEAIMGPALATALKPQTDAEARGQVLLERTTELLDIAKREGKSDRLREEGITEKAIIRLAQRIAGETEDVGQAWLELQNAMDLAVRVQQEGRIGSNHGEFVDDVLARVAELSRDGEYKVALSEIEEALAAQEAQTARLMESGAEVALLEGDTAKAAELLIRKADLDAGGVAEFEALRALLRGYYERGRDKGVNLDLELSIDIARGVLNRAADPDQRGSAGNDLGMALATLGERESGTARLEDAVRAFEAALEEMTRDRVPLDWAGTQMNLGNALATLGARESGTARLEDAFRAYKSALEEMTRDRVPLDWAMTQMNLGSALQRLGARESGTARLEAAVRAYEAALEEWTRDRVPPDWARARMNLGNALATLGERESGTARLEAAVRAYEAVLEEATRDRVPLQWAMVQGNLANIELAFFDKAEDVAHLDRAEPYVQVAREVFTEAQASQYVSICDTIAVKIEARRMAE